MQSPLAVKLLKEGSERAARSKAMDFFAETNYEDLNWDKPSDALHTHIMVNGYAQAIENSDRELGELASLNLTENEAVKLRERFYTKSNRHYNLPASIILTFEDLEGEEIHSQVFHGEWENLPDEILKSDLPGAKSFYEFIGGYRHPTVET